MGPDAEADSGVLGDRQSPETGDTSEPFVWIGLGIFAFGAAYVALKELRKEI